MSDQEGIRILVWGKPGTEKTRFAGSFAHTGKSVHFFDFDNGLLSLNNRDNVTSDLLLDRWKGIGIKRKLVESGFALFETALQREQEKDWPKDVYVIDSWSSLEYEGLSLILRLRGTGPEGTKQMKGAKIVTATEEEYGVLYSHLRQILSYVKGIPKICIVIFHEKTLQDGITKRIITRPSVFGKALPPQVGVFFDEIYHAEQSDKKVVFRTQGSPTYECRSRLNLPEFISPSASAVLGGMEKKGLSL